MDHAKNEASNLTDSFNSSAHTYERRIGSATNAIAAHIVHLISPIPPGSKLLDNACGTGALTREFLKVVPDAVVQAVDNSPGMVEIAKAWVAGKDRADVNVEVMDGQELQFRDQSFDFSVTNFGVFFFLDPVEGIRQIYRTLKSNGTAVVTCWKTIGILPIFSEVQRYIRPTTPVLSMPVFERWMHRETLETTMRLGGFTEIHVEEKEVFLIEKEEKELVAGLVDNMKGMVGENWSDVEKSKMIAATEHVLVSPGSGLSVDLNGTRAVRMVAWIALAKRQEQKEHNL